MRNPIFILIIAFFPQFFFAQITHFGGLNLKNSTFGDTLSTKIAWKFLNEFNKRKHLVLTEQQMLNVPRKKDLDLKALENLYYDNIWVNIADYGYLDPPSYKFLSQNYFVDMPDRVTGEMDMDFKTHYFSATENPRLTSRGPMTNHRTQFVKIGGYTYLKRVDYPDDPKSQVDHQHILTFTKDYIIIEYTHSGKPGDFTSKRRYRNQLIAIPKSLFFTSDGKEIREYIQEQVYASDPYMNSSAELNTSNYENPNENYFSYNGTDTSLPEMPYLNMNPGTKLSTDIADIYYSNAMYMGNMVPDAKTLKQMRPSNTVPLKLGYDIYDFDFIELARYEWYQGEQYIRNDSYFNVLRFHPQEGIHQFKLTSQNDVSTMTYSNNADKSIYRVKKSGPFFHLTNSLRGDQNTTFIIVSYENDLLILDQIDPSTNSKFRIVYGAIAKTI